MGRYTPPPSNKKMCNWKKRKRGIICVAAGIMDGVDIQAHNSQGPTISEIARRTSP